ncbi:MAG: RNA 2',3'-cyclic phosphodiesterase [Magnetovibrionaceae bacterium]
MRLFLGLGLPERITERLQALQAGLGNVRWVKPHNMHITLRFFGEVEGPAAEDLHHALGALSAPAFALTLEGAGHFGSNRQVRAVWAGVQPQPALDHLQAKCERLAQMTGFAPETRKFTPHVTLAWTKGARGLRLGPWLEGAQGLLTERFDVSEMTLYRSHLSASGADYEVLETYPLSS